MLDLCRLIFGMVGDLLRSQVALEAEILVLRQQINVLRRVNPNRLRFVLIDRLIFGGVCRLFPRMYDALAIVRPETVIRWHRLGFRSYWRWKSRRRCGRPTVTVEIRQLIRQMSVANPLWGAPRIHGELLKLGIEVGQTSVAKYMVRRRGPPSQGWRTFLRNHADGIAAMDLFVVPTISFRLLYGLLIMGHGRRQIAVVRSYHASNGRMDRQSAHRGMRLGASQQRLSFSSIDRLVFAGLYRLAPGVLDALKIVRPETVIRWHRAGFRAYWRWKSRPRSGRPKTPLEIRQLIREISLANPLWGAPRLHGELLKLGIDVGQTTVAKYMVRGRRPPSPG